MHYRVSIEKSAGTVRVTESLPSCDLVFYLLLFIAFQIAMVKSESLVVIEAFQSDLGPLNLYGHVFH